MEDTLAAMDWDDAFVDKVPRVDRPFRRKLDDAQYLTKLVVGIDKGKLALPSGLVEGQKLAFILRKILLPTALVTDFDRLPIPFRCQATDVTNGEGVVLRGGDLATAVRASMAFPGVLTPVEIDGRLFVDGGVAVNFPVETARREGATVLIAVDITAPPVSREKLGNIVGVLSQVTSAATVQNVAASRAAIRPEDVSIQPEMEGFGLLAFTRLHEAVALGEKAARAVADRLRALSVPEEEYRAWLARARTKPQPNLTIAAIELVNPSPLSDENLRERIRSKPGPLDLDTLGADLTRLYATGEFDLVDYQIVPQTTGNVLKFLIQDRAWGRTSVRFGTNLTTDFKGDTSFELATTVTRTSLNRLGGEWKLAGGIGGLQIVNGELYQPLTTSGLLFVAPLAGWSREDEFVPAQDGSINDITRREVFAEADAGLTDRRLGELRLGVRRGYLVADSTGGSPLPERARGPWVGGSAPRHRQPGQRVVPKLGRLPPLRDVVADADPRSRGERPAFSCRWPRRLRLREEHDPAHRERGEPGGHRSRLLRPVPAGRLPEALGLSDQRFHGPLHGLRVTRIPPGDRPPPFDPRRGHLSRRDVRGREHLDPRRRRQPFQSACCRLRVSGRRDTPGAGLPRVRAGGEGKFGLVFPDRRALLSYLFGLYLNFWPKLPLVKSSNARLSSKKMISLYACPPS